MAVVDIVKVRQRILQILLAVRVLDTNPSTVDGSVAVYPSTDDITRAILEADIIICRDIIETVGHPFRSNFIAVTSNLANGDLIPAHLGAHGDVEVNDGTGFAGGLLAASRDEILEILSSPTLYPNSKRWYFIEDEKLYHTGTQGRMWNPVLNMGSTVCQAPDAMEDVDVSGGIKLLLKNGEHPDIFEHYGSHFDLSRQLTRSKEYPIPLSQQFERAAA